MQRTEGLLRGVLDGGCALSAISRTLWGAAFGERLRFKPRGPFAPVCLCVCILWAGRGGFGCPRAVGQLCPFGGLRGEVHRLKLPGHLFPLIKQLLRFSGLFILSVACVFQCQVRKCGFLNEKGLMFSCFRRKSNKIWILNLRTVKCFQWR